MVKKISFFLMACIMSLMLIKPIDAKASNPEFYLGYAQPSTSANEGYVTFLIRDNNSGAYQINTFFWYCSASTSSAVESPCYGILQIAPTSFTFRIGGVGSASTAYYCLSQINELERCNIVMNSSSQAFTFDFGRWGKTVLAYKYAGNVGSITSSVVGDAYPFNVYFSEDGSAVLLQGILSCLLSMQNIDSSILNTLNNILSSVDGVENQLSQVVSWLNTLNANTTLIDSKLASLLDKANTLIQGQEESNSWLEKIFNLLEDAPEEEKNEAITQGGNSVSEGTNSIEDKGQGFTDALSGLVGSMSYEGTDCSWTFPTVKLPAISGVMSETTLIQSRDINFGMWIDAIPSDIMLLIRSVLTMGLIVYCFKEFYDTIAYLLTLRRSDNE